MSGLRRTSSFLWRHSRTIRLAAAGTLGAAALVSWAGAEPAPAVKSITVASRDIPSGSAIGADDVTTASDTLGLSTPGAAELIGETARGPIAAGEPITATRITPGRSVAPAPGTVVFPLTLSDDRVAGLLVSGDRVDVLVAPDTLHGGQPRVAAEGVEVLAVPGAEDGAAGSALTRGGSVVLLSVNAQQAAELASVRSSDHISVTIG